MLLGYIQRVWLQYSLFALAAAECLFNQTSTQEFQRWRCLLKISLGPFCLFPWDDVPTALERRWCPCCPGAPRSVLQAIHLGTLQNNLRISSWMRSPADFIRMTEKHSSLGQVEEVLEAVACAFFFPGFLIGPTIINPAIIISSYHYLQIKKSRVQMNALLGVKLTLAHEGKPEKF